MKFEEGETVYLLDDPARKASYATPYEVIEHDSQWVRLKGKQRKVQQARLGRLDEMKRKMVSKHFQRARWSLRALLDALREQGVQSDLEEAIEHHLQDIEKLSKRIQDATA